MKYQVTIYSPADQEEHVFETPAPFSVAEKLIDQMEPGSWFKIERTA